MEGGGGGARGAGAGFGLRTPGSRLRVGSEAFPGAWPVLHAALRCHAHDRAAMLLLREGKERGRETNRGSFHLHLQRMRAPLHADRHRRGRSAGMGGPASRALPGRNRAHVPDEARMAPVRTRRKRPRMVRCAGSRPQPCAAGGCCGAAARHAWSNYRGGLSSGHRSRRDPSARCRGRSWGRVAFGLESLTTCLLRTLPTRLSSEAWWLGAARACKREEESKGAREAQP
jgi:hypothetical protein